MCKRCQLCLTEAEVAGAAVLQLLLGMHIHR
jgi:hypothetical protein